MNDEKDVKERFVTLLRNDEKATGNFYAFDLTLPNTL